jgi:hypothetical protein
VTQQFAIHAEAWLHNQVMQQRIGFTRVETISHVQQFLKGNYFWIDPFANPWRTQQHEYCFVLFSCC